MAQQEETTIYKTKSYAHTIGTWNKKWVLTADGTVGRGFWVMRGTTACSLREYYWQKWKQNQEVKTITETQSTEMWGRAQFHQRNWKPLSSKFLSDVHINSWIFTVDPFCCWMCSSFLLIYCLVTVPVFVSATTPVNSIQCPLECCYIYWHRKKDNKTNTTSQKTRSAP